MSWLGRVHDRLRHARDESWLKSMLAGIGRARTLGLAAEMSFWLFLSLVPLAVIAGFVAARIATAHLGLLWSGLDALPTPVRDMLIKQIRQVAAWNGGTVAPIAALTFVWLASSGVHAIFDAVEIQAGTSRPWWKKRLLALATCIGLAIGGAIVALLAAGIDWLKALASGPLPGWLVHLPQGGVGQAVRWAVGAAIAVGLTAGLYRLAVPRAREAHERVLPGAALAVALQAALGWLYGEYVTKLGGGGSAYLAGLAAVGVTMMTLWLFSIALLVGAQLNRVVTDRRLAGGLRPHGP
jgi:membrane protein